MIETCEICGFDATGMSMAQVHIETAAVSRQLVDFVQSCTDADLLAPPSSQRWSATEYLFHLSQALATTRDLIERGLAADRPVIEPPDPDVGIHEFEQSSRQPADVVGRFERRVDRLLPQIERLDGDGSVRTIVMGHSRIRGDIGEVSLARVARNGLHELFHHDIDVREVVGIARSVRINESTA
ncbi:MAG: DinB family protein [Ilumatobacteraceae bacterium]